MRTETIFACLIAISCRQGFFQGLLAEPGPEKLAPEDIAPGLVYAPYQMDGIKAHVLRFNLNTPTLHIRSLKAAGKETLRTMVERLNQSGERVVGAINGDFFRQETSAGVPYGLQVSDEKLIFGPRRRTMIGFGKDNLPFIGIVELKASLLIGAGKDFKKDAREAIPIDNVNVFAREVQQSSGVILYTPAFKKLDATRYTGLVVAIDKLTPALQVGEPFQGTVLKADVGEQSSKVPPGGCLLYFIGETARAQQGRLAPGTPVSLQITLPPITGSVPQAIGGGPRLIRAGKVSVEMKKEEFDSFQAMEIEKKRHPRSAVGYDKARKQLFLVVIEGRHEESMGMRMDELANFMLRLGCYEAMGFDGGGSSAMYVLGRGVVSRSIEDREIANSLLITMERKFPARKEPEKAGPDAPGAEKPGQDQPPPEEEALEPKD